MKMLRWSKAGAVLDRKAKSVKPSPEAKALFGLERDSMTPNELIRALLKAPVELLWLGGIGTCVKASHESDGLTDFALRSPPAAPGNR